MKREFLKELGLDDKQTEAVMSQYGKEVNQYQDQSTQVASLKEQLEDAKGQIDSRDKQLKELGKESSNSKEMQAKIKELEEANKQARKESEAKLAQQQKSFAIQTALSKSGAIENKAVQPFIDTEKVSLDDNGNLIGLQEQLDAAKKDHAFLFKQEEKQEEKKPAPQLVQGGNNSSEVQSDPSKMSLEDQNKLYQTNPSKWRSLFQK